MNLSTGRILIIVVLVVAGLAVLANGFVDDGSTVAATSASPTPSTSVSVVSTPTDTASPTVTPEPQTDGVLVIALNGTNVTGAGAAAQDLLISDGYKQSQPAADAPGSSGVKKTTVYYRDDENAAQNKADATYIADTYFDGAPVKALDPGFSDVVPDSVTVVIVVGEDFASNLTA